MGSPEVGMSLLYCSELGWECWTALWSAMQCGLLWECGAPLVSQAIPLRVWKLRAFCQQHFQSQGIVLHSRVENKVAHYSIHYIYKVLVKGEFNTMKHSFSIPWSTLGLPWWLRWRRGCLQCGRPGFDPWVRKIPWKRAWQHSPGMPGEFHAQRSLVGYSPWGCKELDTTGRLTLSLFHGSLCAFPKFCPVTRAQWIL